MARHCVTYINNIIPVCRIFHLRFVLDFNEDDDGLDIVT